MPIERINVNGRMGLMSTVPVVGNIYEIIWDDGGNTLILKEDRDRVSNPAAPPVITSGDLGDVINQLSLSKDEICYASIGFIPRGSTDGKRVLLRYELVNGMIGFDLILRGRKNKKYKDSVSDFARRLGCELVLTEKIGVIYLRYEGPGSIDLGRAILNEFYGLGPEEKLRLLALGFSWPPCKPCSDKNLQPLGFQDKQAT